MTRRATQPLSINAVRAANAAVYDMTDPPGRALSPTDIRDAAARRAWMDAYESAGGRVEQPTLGAPVDEPAGGCPNRKNWVELRYYHCDGTPVPGARYVVEADGFSASGVLDDDGFVHIAGVPNSVTQVQFRFDSDPEPYEPRPPSVPANAPASREAASDAIDDAWKWLWGTVQGDFNQDATISQIAVNGAIGLIPIADQVLDARDLIAGITHLVQYYGEDEERQRAHADSLGLSYETWLWIAVFLTAIGCIPVVGSAVKGVLKTLIRALQDAGKAAGGLSAAQLRKIWEWLVSVLNGLGIRQGNAHRWLVELQSQLPRYMDDAAARIRGAANTFRKFLDDVADYTRKLERVPFVDNARVRNALAKIGDARRALDKVLENLEHQKRLINDWLGEQLRRVVGGKEASHGVGSVNTPASASQNALSQARRLPGEPLPQSVVDKIKAIEKGDRPNPKSYMSPARMDALLAEFEDGATRITSRQNLDAYGPAHRDGTAFVMPTKEVDKLLADTKGNKRALEQALGLPEGHLDKHQLMRVDVPDPKSLNLRIPSGNEAGTIDEFWIPGGQLPGGIPEAVIDLGGAPKSSWTSSPLL